MEFGLDYLGGDELSYFDPQSSMLGHRRESWKWISPPLLVMLGMAMASSVDSTITIV